MKIRPTTRTIGALGGALLLVVMTASLALATPIQGATISINPSSAPAGASVTVSGNNFTPGSSIVIGYTTGDCSTNVTAIAGASATAGADGGVTVTFTWPATDTGTYYICATDTNTHSSTRSTGPLQVVPPATLTVSAPVYSGQPVTVTGAHFAPSTANGGGSVDVSYGGADGCATSAGTATVGADGSFSITFNAPHADSSTPITIVAVEPQGTCGKTNPGPTFQAKANATVSPAPSIRVSSPLNAGQNATVTGQSFLPVGAGISISYGASGSDGCATSLGSATAGADGSFSFTFKVPDVAADKSVVIAATSPLSSCAASPKLKATANATFKATKVTPTPPLLEYCLIGLLLLLLLLLLLFLIFRRRKEDEPVTIEERDTVRPSGSGAPGSAMIDRQIVARDRRGKEYVIA
ncbi:MAG TPA: hypothetical protein VID73_00220, partial [Ktedonobacterales bacterium]